MPIIRPGKLNLRGGAPKKPERQEESVPKRDIWDDFTPFDKKKKKVEFEKTSNNRMVPKHLLERDGEKVVDEVVDEQVGPARHVRTDYEFLEEKLGYIFKNKELISRSLTHRSALGLKDRADYERLEFLGDAVLDLSVAHLLSDRHPEAKEGELSKMRAALVNTQTLAGIAKSLEIGQFIRLGRGEFSSGGSERPSILADVMEALIGGMYRDSNFDTSMQVVEKIFGDMLMEVSPHDPKTELQEVLHVGGSEPPQYLLEMVEGPEHAPTFVTVVVVDNEIAGRGRGNTKKASQQSAAEEALARFRPSNEDVVLLDGQTEILFENLLIAANA